MAPLMLLSPSKKCEAGTLFNASYYLILLLSGPKDQVIIYQVLTQCSNVAIYVWRSSSLNCVYFWSQLNKMYQYIKAGEGERPQSHTHSRAKNLQ